MVGQLTLDQPVVVRIHVSEPEDLFHPSQQRRQAALHLDCSQPDRDAWVTRCFVMCAPILENSPLVGWLIPRCCILRLDG